MIWIVGTVVVVGWRVVLVDRSLSCIWLDVAGIWEGWVALLTIWTSKGLTIRTAIRLTIRTPVRLAIRTPVRLTIRTSVG